MSVLHKCDACSEIVGRVVSTDGPAYRGTPLLVRGCKIELFIPWQLLMPGWRPELNMHICTPCLNRASQAVVKELAQCKVRTP